MHDRILILDFGSQVTQLIARRIREAHVFCEIHPNDVSDAFIREFAPKGIILSGSHASTYEEHELRAPQAVFELGVPVLGICYGMFTMAVQLGGQVEASTHREFGYAEVRARGHTRLLARHRGLLDDRGPRHAQGLDEPRRQGHRAAARLRADGLDAELPDRRHGRREPRLLRRAVPSRGHAHRARAASCSSRFVLEICGAKPDWVMGNYIDEAVARIREQVGDDEVILGLSGGVDSSVAAALIHRAIGDRLTCVFVDHGLLRLDEGRMVMEMFADRLHAKVIAVDASEQFLGQLAGVADPEAKRKIIGREFVEVFTREAGRLKQREVAGAGHDLSRRDRVGRREDEEGDLDQEPPQRRRPARDARPEAARAAARAVQGRGARARRRARPAARHGLSPSVPGPGPGRAHPRRGEARVRRPAAPRRRDLHRGAAQHHRPGERQDLVRADLAGLRRVPAGARASA